MNKQIAKKTIILYVLKMIEKGSCKERPITFTNIAKVLKNLGIPCDRKTVGRNVEYLIEFGYPIIKLPGAGCYIDETAPKKSFI